MIVSPFTAALKGTEARVGGAAGNARPGKRIKESSTSRDRMDIGNSSVAHQQGIHIGRRDHHEPQRVDLRPPFLTTQGPVAMEENDVWLCSRIVGCPFDLAPWQSSLNFLHTCGRHTRAFEIEESKILEDFQF